VAFGLLAMAGEEVRKPCIPSAIPCIVWRLQRGLEWFLREPCICFVHASTCIVWSLQMFCAVISVDRAGRVWLARSGWRRLLLHGRATCKPQ
jgi:hypothetical protein